MRILPTTIDPLRWPSNFYFCRRDRTGARTLRWGCENTIKSFYLVFLSHPGAISPMAANLPMGANLHMITVPATTKHRTAIPGPVKQYRSTSIYRAFNFGVSGAVYSRRVSWRSQTPTYTPHTTCHLWPHMVCFSAWLIESICFLFQSQ